ncbi:NUDIX hydrolase (plasmid) [Rhizobium sp. NIBRBAC000502774]|uniref:NUDIX hydrolase n=1 Tax=Agrobacterium tumefaciens TaxID=358 RepID=UPI0011407BFB|nr:NUDIX hydrolase [Agrobacterium tumefaciens]QDG94086.1 NUDIX hydrolase [Rhizobium sp. NIBRBAC000502774]
MTRATTASRIVSSPDDRGQLQQVGVLPWRIGRDGERKVLLVTDRERERWIVPTGPLVKACPPLVMASRHAFKVAGIIGDMSPAPVMTYRYIKTLNDKPQLVCCVTIFGMNVRGTLTHWREKAHRKRRWFSPLAAADRMGDIALADFVRKLDAEPGCWHARRHSGHLILGLSERQGSGV